MDKRNLSPGCCMYRWHVNAVCVTPDAITTLSMLPVHSNASIIVHNWSRSNMDISWSLLPFAQCLSIVLYCQIDFYYVIWEPHSMHMVWNFFSFVCLFVCGYLERGWLWTWWKQRGSTIHTLWWKLKMTNMICALMLGGGKIGFWLGWQKVLKPASHSLP